MRKNIHIISDAKLIKIKLTELSSLISLEQLDTLTSHQYSRNSLLAMTKDWNLYLEFCVTHHITALPSTTDAVRMYLQKLASERKFATVRRNAVTIGLMHRILSQKDPTTNSLVRQTLAELRLNKNGDAKQATPLTLEHITQYEQIVLNDPSLQEIRDLAICYVMFECAMKRSELKTLDFDQLCYQTATTLIYLGDSHYSLSSHAHNALEKWRQFIPEGQGILFRAIDRHGNIANRPLDDSSIYRVVRRVGEKLGISTTLSGQSVRVGAVKELVKQGMKAPEIQLFGRWMSPAMPYQYIGNRVQADAEKIVFKTIKPWD
ncbi:tyrosine-type recombinase/integrase [Vibrio profundum]|uniref:tyrosine-type recombinase/integrase n=1 Tax=Vibrio profundum TaxID=2910247 RepID=UPI003D09D1B5